MTDKTQQDRKSVGLPLRDFFYTIDQIAYLLGVTESTLKERYFHHEGRSAGAAPKSKLLARNIAPPLTDPDWRVAERELIRWLKHKKFRIYDRAWVQK